MSWATASAIAGLLLTMIVGFGSVMRALGRLEQKFDIVWDWYVEQTYDGRNTGRRHVDHPPRWEARDKS